MERKACHLDGFCSVTFSIGALGKCDTEYLRCYYSVGTVCLIEVSATEQKDRIGVLRLEVIELTHHRGNGCIFFGHIFK